MGLTERQARAALDHTRSKCVTAGAGTGKTHVLVQKYISLLESGVDVGDILALTFTEKAAAEMKVRVRQALAERGGEAWDAVRDEFLWAKISTFHAFCASVLREFPLEAGVGPGVTVLDEREAILLADEAMNDLIYGDPPQGARDAVIGVLRAVGAYELKNYLEALYSRRDDSETFFAALRGSEEVVLDAWTAAVEGERAKARAAFFDRAGPSLETLKDLSARYPGERDPAETYLRAVEPHLAADAVAALAGVHTGSRFRANMGQKQNWAGDDLERLRAAYGVLKGCLKDHETACPPAIDPADPFTRATLDFLHDLGTVYRAFTGAVEAEKRRRNALDFDDLVNRTHRLFADHADIAAHFRDRFRFVLVDEFQDTDPVQIAIIHAILGREPGNLFIVGDPKQSIYLFREADVAQFRHTRDLIEQDLGGETIALDVNFRSTPEVVGFTNAVFGALMAESGRPWEFLYEPLRAFRQEAGSVELLLCPKVKDRAAGRRAEAEMVARKIRAIVERGEKQVYRNGEGRPAGYGDIAVLLERRTNLSYYEWALERYGVPYRVHAGLGFYERQEVYDVYNILRFLVNDLDDVALYGLLRSPYFGFSDARLFAVAGSEASLWERLQRSPDPDAAAAVSTLRGWLSVARRLPPARLIRRIVEESGIAVVFGGMAGGEQAAANVEKLIAIAREADCSTLADLVGELGRCIDERQREGDAPLELAPGDGVSIMTVHAAKGLEFPVVVVPDLAETPKTGGATIMVGGGLLLGVSIPNPANDHEREETPVLRLLKAEYRQKEEAERKRLFYVAATRARDHLILCGVMPGEVPETLPAAKTRMAWLAHCLGLSSEVSAQEEAALGALRIALTLDPAKIPVDVDETSPVYIPVPDDVPAAGGGPGKVPPVTGEEEHVYSASEIEHYLSGPGVSRPPRFSAGPDSITRGLIVHEVFRGRDPAVVLRRYGRDSGWAEELQGHYERFLASPLMQGKIADHREVPFWARVNVVPFEGAIDRLVQRPDGAWILVDYKTGTPGGVEEYAVQITVYRHAAAQLLGQPVTPYLYFVDADRWVEVAVDEEQVFATIEQAVRGIEERSF